MYMGIEINYIQAILIPKDQLITVKTHYIPSPTWGPMGKCMVISRHSAVVHWVPHSIVGLIITHAALIILQPIRIWDISRDGGKLHGTSHTSNLNKDRLQNNTH